MNNHLEIFNSKISSNGVLVYLYLERHGARKKQCFHSIRTIASNLNISDRTVRRVLNELESNRFILRTHRYRANGAKSSNLYEILK
ncbi:helix-turn-helix domain-containing protein [Erysipelothrix sp. HDW6B]|uniref:helix-turn-helix domain-containing protein n=1 Tax=Erysipelothrix sp. HDW6B TaxID=2714929 RepID=UPI001408CAC8|nr:helix-turn-helix domain-containing protein [Erysipelothrix sp. HDW6B]